MGPLRNTLNGKTFWVAWISPVNSTAETEITIEADYLTRRDIYGIGSVLLKKYRMLRYSYTVFMIGLVVSVLLFIGAFFIEAR